MKIEISEKSSNEVKWEMLKPGDVVGWGGNLFLAISIGTNIQFLNLDEFKVVTLDYVRGLTGAPVLMDAILQVSHVGVALPKFKDPWEYKVVDSSWIDEAGYNRETKIFKISTKTAQTYKYKDVPEYIWDDFLNAWSQGSYYNNEIKGQFERIE